MISLKIMPGYFGFVSAGKKTFEVRKDDRYFTVGEELQLCEWNGKYTGRYISAVISYILRADAFPEGIQPGYCVLGLKHIATHVPGEGGLNEQRL